MEGLYLRAFVQSERTFIPLPACAAMAMNMETKQGQEVEPQSVALAVALRENVELLPRAAYLP